MVKKKSAFLIATHGLSKRLFDLYDTIESASSAFGDIYFLYHQTDENLPLAIASYNSYFFTNEVLFNLGYEPIANELIPGNNHFALLAFFRQYTSYDYYWYIEDDVVYNGDWKLLIEKINFWDADWTSNFIQRHTNNVYWSWWDTLSHPKLHINKENRLKSFNPFYRISNSALTYIHQSLLSGWRGHHEVLIPTLLHINKFNIFDIGGDGEFVTEEFKNKFCNNSTFRFRPAINYIPKKSDNLLYHPVKSNYDYHKTDITHVYLRQINNRSSQIIFLYLNFTFKSTMIRNSLIVKSQKFYNYYLNDGIKDKLILPTSIYGTWVKSNERSIVLTSETGKEKTFHIADNNLCDSEGKKIFIFVRDSILAFEIINFR